VSHAGGKTGGAVSRAGGEADGAVTVSTRSLIGLRADGEALVLPGTSIRAQQSGTFVSAYKGRGVEFEESRAYQPGDDARTIDWRVTARTGQVHTKLFLEERQRPVLLCVDFRAGMYFATRGAFKSVVAARAAAMLAWSSHHHGDRVGGLLFGDRGHRELRPRREQAAVLRLVGQIAAFARWTGPAPAPPAALPLSAPLSKLRRVARHGALVFVISDFRVLDPGVEGHLSRLARHNAVVLIAIHDAIEAELPPPGLYRVTDGRDDLVLNSGDPRAREAYRARFQARRDRLRGLCRRYGMSLIPVATDADLKACLRTDLLRRAMA